MLSPAVLAQVAGSGSEGNPGKPTADGVWITLGSDAFDALHEESFTYGLRPLEAHAERRDVVVTRVERRDLARLSEVMHKRFNRCSGFLQHESLDAAETALAQATDLSNSFASLVGFQIDQPDLVAALVAQLDDTQIRSTIEHLSTSYNNRYYTTPSGQQSAVWIRDTWQSLAAGRSDVTVELYNHSGYDQPSVILTLDGTTKASEVVVIGGHLDSTRGGSKTDPNFVAPGADDNASGIAVITEVLRVAMAEGFVPQRTIKLMGYAAEEVGLLGSQDIAADHASQGVDVVAVMQLDMTAYNGSVSDITLVGDYTNADLRSFVGQLIDTYQPGILRDTSNCGYACSDHASWHNQGFPAVIPFEATVGQHNPNIHTTGDTRANYGNSEDHAMKFARLAAAFLAETGIDDASGGGGQTASYDGSLGAPVCDTVDVSCDSAGLLDGRGTVGPEPNQPNTLDACTDGTSGSYHSDESIDAIRVSTAGGTDFTPGETVNIEVDVWAYSDGSSDRLDLYYASDATSPSWTYLTTITPPGGGAQTLTASYTLPAGSLQAVRGNFRYQGAQSPCSGGSYDDADDLVFAVNSAGNTPPSVDITSPASGASYTQGDSVSFAGSANDAEDGDLNASLSWTSSLDGAIGSGATFSTTGLSVGGHTITASVTDSGGAPGSDSISITVNEPTNNAPVVSITAPADGSNFDEGTSVSFTGTANDTEDGNLSSNLSWSSSLDGSIGSGGSFSTSTLSVGTHTITASVTDSGGAPGSDSISVTINPVGGGGTCNGTNCIDWDVTTTVSFATQDTDANFQVQDGGDSMYLEDNTWRRTTQTFNITANTVVEFDFTSTAQGEIHGIGFDEDNTLSSNRIFKVHGSQNYGITDFDNYAGGTTTYSIPVGQYFTGSAMYLVLVNDNDAGQNNNSTFTNVRVYEDVEPPGGCSVEEDFESGSSGWTTSGNCSTGTFVVNTPTQQTSTVVTQPGGDHTTGSGNALFTATNTSAGSNDVDGGTCVVISPVYSVADPSDVSLWYFHGQRDSGDDAADGFELEMSTDGGSSWSYLVDIGDVQTVAAWTEVTSTVGAGTSVRFRASATDGSGPGDIVEAGLDDLSICPQ